MNGLAFILTGIALCIGFSGCSADKSSEEAKAMYGRAEKALEVRQYSRARAGLDSVNKLYPTAVDVREECIILKSKIALKEAQDSLQLADSLLQLSKKSKASATEIALRQQHFDNLCLKVRFYYKKIDKLNALKARMDSQNE